MTQVSLERPRASPYTSRAKNQLLVALALLAAACGPRLTPGQRLFRAARGGGASDVRAALAAGARVDARDDDGWTALMHAAAAGRPEAVDALMEAGADPTVATRHELEPPLILAVRWNKAEVVRALLRGGASPLQVDHLKMSPLHWAALLGRTASAQALLDAGALPNLADPGGNTPLIMAAARGHGDTVKLLLSHGALPQWRNLDGDDARALARERGHPEIAALLKP